MGPLYGTNLCWPPTRGLDWECPSTMVNENGTEFTSMAILRWTQERQNDWRYIAPGKPLQNGIRRELDKFCATDIRWGWK